MNAPILAQTPRRPLTDIKVIEFDTSHQAHAVRIEWIDEVGQHCRASRYGAAATRLIADVRAATAIGEDARRGFIYGWISGLSDGGGLDD